MDTNLSASEAAQAKCPPNFKPGKGVKHGMPPRVTKRGNAAKKAAQRERNLAERQARNRGKAPPGVKK